MIRPLVSTTISARAMWSMSMRWNSIRWDWSVFMDSN